jgi:hypothetical protein
MSSAIANFGIAAGITSVICYALVTRARNQRRRRARASGSSADSGTEFSGTHDGFGIASWFSGDPLAPDGSGHPSDGSGCSFSSDGGGSGGGGDGGGGGD